jgi:predicted ATPase
MPAENQGLIPSDDWPATLPAVHQVLTSGLELGPVTVLVGENGSGKSTLVEAVAMAYGLNAEGGSTHARNRTRESESPLHRALRIVRDPGASRWGYFLRAETTHGLLTYLEGTSADRDPVFHELSHGESFLELLTSRMNGSGFYVLDEPEAGLSFTSCLALVARLADLVALGTVQVLIATHSPVVAALPGATLLEVGDHGLRETQWADLDLVTHYRKFLDDPDRFLRHLFDSTE